MVYNQDLDFVFRFAWRGFCNHKIYAISMSLLASYFI